MELWDILDKNRNETGELVERGEPMNKGEYHLVVFAFIKNSQGKIIISKRSPNKTYPNTWEITGGSAVTGDNSSTAILREVKEELGIDLKSNGRVIKSIKQEVEYSYFVDIWLFEEDVDFDDIICQEEEVSEARLATKEEIKKLIDDKKFMVGMPCVIECLETI